MRYTFFGEPPIVKLFLLGCDIVDESGVLDARPGQPRFIFRLTLYLYTLSLQVSCPRSWYLVFLVYFILITNSFAALAKRLQCHANTVKRVWGLGEMKCQCDMEPLHRAPLRPTMASHDGCVLAAEQTVLYSGR